MVTGSRDWDDSKVIFDALWELTEEQADEKGRVRLTLIHGDCRGADKTADRAAKVIGCYDPIEVYPADWRNYGKAAGFIRNKVMIETKPDIVLAFQRNKSKGTQHVIDMANALGIRVMHFEKVEATLSAQLRVHVGTQEDLNNPNPIQVKGAELE